MLVKMIGKLQRELGSYSCRYVDELSAGELQKVVIARVLTQKTDLLLFDEPTSNLDFKNHFEILSIIKKIAAIVTMHDLNLAMRFRDKFLLLKKDSIYALKGLI